MIVQVEVTSAYFSNVEPECHYHVKCYNFLQCYMQVHLLLTITRQPDCPDGLGTLLQLSLCRYANLSLSTAPTGNGYVFRRMEQIC